MIEVPETPAEKIPAPITQVVPFLAGAGNSLLFNLPEAAIKGIGGDKVREIVDTYKKLNPGFGAGETVGTVGSVLIPGGAVARTLGGGAKAIGASKLASGLEKVADVAAGPVGIKQGLTAAAEQAIPRAISEQVETGDIGETAAGLGTNVALGGGLGAGLSLGKKAGNLVKPYFDVPSRGSEMIKESAENIVGNVLGVNKKALGPLLAGLSPNSKLDKIDTIVQDIASILEDGPVKIRTPEKAEQVFGEGGKIFKPFEKAYNSSPIGSFADNLDEIINHPDITQPLMEYGYHGETALLDLIKSFDSVTSVQPNKWFAQRGFLGKKISEGMRADPQSTAAIQGELARGLKQIIDDRASLMVEPKAIAEAMSDIIPKSDMDRIISSGYDPDLVLSVSKQKYPAILAAQSALVAKKFRDLAPTSSAGSKTAASQIFKDTATGGSPATNVINALGGEGINKAASEFSKFVSTERASAIRNRLMRNPGLVDKIDEGIPESAQKVLLGAGKAAASAIERAPQVLPGEESDGDIGPLAIPAGGPVPELQPVDFEMPANPLDQSLELAWQLEDPQGNIEAQSPGAKQAFIEGVKKNLTKRDGSLNYLRAADALFPGKPDDAKNFREAYTALQRVRLAMPNAVKLVTVGNSRAEADKQAVVDSVSEVLKKAQGMKEEDAIKRVKGILDSPFKTPAQKGELLFNLMRTADPYSFGEGGLLERAGVM